MRKTEIENFYSGQVMINDGGKWRPMTESEKKLAKEAEFFKLERETKKEEQKCPVCGTSFFPHATQVYCDDECRKKSLKTREKAFNKLNENPSERPRNPSVESLKSRILRKK